MKFSGAVVLLVLVGLTSIISSEVGQANAQVEVDVGQCAAVKANISACVASLLKVGTPPTTACCNGLLNIKNLDISADIKTQCLLRYIHDLFSAAPTAPTTHRDRANTVQLPLPGVDGLIRIQAACRINVGVGISL